MINIILKIPSNIEKNLNNFSFITTNKVKFNNTSNSYDLLADMVMDMEQKLSYFGKYLIQQNYLGQDFVELGMVLNFDIFGSETNHVQ